MPDLILRQDKDHIARLVLNSPTNYNALSVEMIEALTAQLDSIARDDGVRVVILAASGKAFCAGHDLRQMQAARDGGDGGGAAFADLFNS